jgi:hypothetical protein
MDPEQRRDEDAFHEVETVLLYVSEVIDRAVRAQQELQRLGAEPHLIAAMEETEGVMRAEIRRIRQRAHFASMRSGG